MGAVLRRLMALVAASLLAAPGCWPLNDRAVLSPMSLRERTGAVYVIHEGKATPVEGSASISPSDVIRLGPGAAAEVRLEDDRHALLKGEGRTQIISGGALRSARGSVLFHGGDPLTVQLGDVRAVGAGGLYRIDRRFASIRAASYRGSLTLESPGQPSQKVPALYEVSIAAGAFSSAPRPYQIDPRDPWDQVHLESVLDLDVQLEKLATGLRNQTGGRRPGAAALTALLGQHPGAQGDKALKRYLRIPAADLLIGVGVAKRSPFPLPAALRKTFLLRDQGASWGNDAALMRADPEALVASLDRIVSGMGVVAGRDPGTDLALSRLAGEGRGNAGSGANPPGDEGTAGGREASGGSTGTPSSGGSPGGSGGSGGSGDSGGSGGFGDPEDSGGSGGSGGSGDDGCTDLVDCTLDEIGVTPSPSPSGDILDDIVPAVPGTG
ncbi:MAG TPA: hypothetical protein VE975_03610 [Actinomycetota bacterium]|nr:hypothetical protein [Actinomycetota bacterium]